MDSTDQSLSTINKGKTARVIRSQTENMLIDKEDLIIDRLVQQYNAGQLKDDEIRGKIGEIASLRWLRTELESTIRLGDAAAEKEYSSG